jgi:hypothetical protein
LRLKIITENTRTAEPINDFKRRGVVT